MLNPIAVPVVYGWTLEYVNTTTWARVVEHYAPDADEVEIRARTSELRAAGYVQFSEISA